MEMRDLQKMVEGLRSYNRWRRGDEEIPQPDPKEVGRLIEGVCEVVVEFREAIADRDIARLAAMDSDRAHDRMVAELENVYKERDEARDAADAMERAGAEQARRADENREWALRAERERDEAREALRTLAEHGENEIQKLIKECDEARNKMADALQEVDLRTLDYERMKQERDEAREQLAAAKHFLEKYIAERDEAREKLSKILKLLDLYEAAK